MEKSAAVIETGTDNDMPDSVPPPYEEDDAPSEDAALADSKMPAPEYTPGPSSQMERPEPSANAYPPQAHHVPATSRTLNMSVKNLLSTQMNITDSNNDWPLYFCEYKKGRKSHVRVTAADTSREVGTGSFHLRNMTLECTLGDPPQPCPVKPKALFTSVYTFPSPLSSDQSETSPRWSWRNDKIIGINIICEDENGVQLARLEMEHFSLKRRCTLELTAAVDGSDDQKKKAMEAILVTGLANVYVKRQKNLGIAAGASAVVAAC